MEGIRNAASKKCECTEIGLRDFCAHEIKDLFNVEKQLVKALPKKAKAASSLKLKSAFSDHHKVAEGHVHRLEQILTRVDEKGGGTKCKDMEGLAKEGKESIGEKEKSDIKNVGLMVVARKGDHYEMAGYNAGHGYAQKLGLNEGAAGFQKILKEVEQADKDLTTLFNELLANAGTESV